MGLPTTPIALLLAASASIPTSPDLGKADAQCSPNEAGPSFRIRVLGLKDRIGRLKLEVYPSNDTDFLEDDNILVSQGKVFRRVEVGVPRTGPIQLCVKLPAAGKYAVVLLHDRDSNRKFGLTVDGIGFGGNPKLSIRKPSAASVSLSAGSGPSHHRIIMNYHQGWFMVAPLEGN